MLNHVTLQGHLGGPAEIRELPNSGGRVARMRVAHREAWKKGDEWRERVSWLTVVTFREGLIDNVIKAKAIKGARVILTGRLQDNSYRDSDGRFHQQIEIVIGPGHELQLTPKDPAGAGTADAGTGESDPGTSGLDMSDPDPADAGMSDPGTSDPAISDTPADDAATAGG